MGRRIGRDWADLAGEMAMRRFWLAGMILWSAGCLAAVGAEPPGKMPVVVVSGDGKTFVEEGTGKELRPWGFNYDHDEKGRLIEDYWHDEWEKVVGDMREMKASAGMWCGCTCKWESF